MRIRLLLAIVTTLLLVPACTQATPESWPTLGPSPTSEATATPTKTPESPSPTPQPTQTPVPTSTPEPTFTPILEPTPTPQPQVYVVAYQIDVYESPNEASCLGYIIPGKRFTIIGQEAGWVNITMAPSEGSMSSEGWIQASEIAYHPEGQIPPPPPTCQPPPYPACEGPHWPNRTPDRKTGIICDLTKGSCHKYIHEPGSVREWSFPGSGIWTEHCWSRSAIITNIDRQTATITFDVGDGLTIRRCLTRSTWIQMWVHEYTRDMLLTGEECPYGGNLCDLEVGDAARIYFKTEEEAGSPDPGPNNLLLITIVQ